MGGEMSKPRELSFKFKEGDRVTEVNRMRQLCVGPAISTAAKNQVLRILSATRAGTVSSVGVIQNLKGARRIYVDVIWDGSKLTSRHEQMRLALLDNK